MVKFDSSVRPSGCLFLAIRFLFIWPSGFGCLGQTPLNHRFGFLCNGKLALLVFFGGMVKNSAVRFSIYEALCIRPNGPVCILQADR